MEIKILKETGTFAEDKDKARSIKQDQIIPALNREEDVVLDFSGVDSATQSFMHALLSDVIRQFGIGILQKIYFKNCNPVVKEIIKIVTEYMQDPIGLNGKK